MLRLILIVFLCASPLACRSALKAGPINSALLDAGEAGRWYLHAGSCFYELWGDVEFRCLPKDPAATGVIKLLDSYSLRGFNLTSDKEAFVVWQAPPGSQPKTQESHYFAVNRDLKIVDEGESPNGVQRLSPDGKFLLHASAWRHGTGQITVTEVATKKRNVVARDHWKGDGPARGLPEWAPDSRRFVYTTNKTELAIFDVAEGKAKAIGPGRAATWSPDGATIAYLPANPSLRKTLQYDVETGKTSELFAFKVRRSLVWSPDSRFLIFRRGYANTIYGDLSFFDRKTGKLHRTGKRVASLADGMVHVLPDWLAQKLVLIPDNPNRDKLPVKPVSAKVPELKPPSTSAAAPNAGVGNAKEQ